MTAIVNVDRLNVRSGPGTGYTILGKALTGDSLTLSGRNSDGSWLEVEYPAGSGKQGWVAATYVTANGATDPCRCTVPAATQSLRRQLQQRAALRRR